MIAEVDTEVLPSLRIQFVGNGSVIESLPIPRMAVKQPAPVAQTVGGHGCVNASTRTSQGPSWT